MDDKGRRDFLRSGWKLGGALLFGAAAYTGYEALRPLTAGSSGAKIAAGTVSSFAKDTSTYVPAGRMYVVNANDYLFALSQKCPHLGCHVPYCESSGRFECRLSHERRACLTGAKVPRPGRSAGAAPGALPARRRKRPRAGGRYQDVRPYSRPLRVRNLVLSG